MSIDPAQDPAQGSSPEPPEAPPSPDAPPPYPPPPGAYPYAPYGAYAAPGYPMYPVVAVSIRTSTFAILSLIFSLLVLAGLWFVGPLMGVIFGHIALNEIKKSNGMVEGQGLATAGLVVGYIGLGLSVLCIGFYLLIFLGPLLFSTGSS